MEHAVPTGWSWFLLPLLVAGCAAPVTETELLHGETLAEIQQSAITGEDVSVGTRQVLRVLDLIEMWEEQPAEIPAAIAASEGGQPDTVKRLATAEIYYELADRAADPTRAEELYLEAVLTVTAVLPEVRTELSAFDPWQRLMADIYNRGLARFLALGQEAHGQLSTWRTVSSVSGEHAIRIAEGHEYWDAEILDELIPAEERQYSGRLPNRHREFGLGATLIAVQEGDSREFGPYELPNTHSLPATAVLRPSENGGLELRIYNPYATDRALIPGLDAVPLSTDLSAPLGHLVAVAEEATSFDNLGFFEPEALEAQRGIYMMQPYDPDRIPVILVHGLWSSPLTWIEVINAIWGDRELRDRYQVWIYLYPTGLALYLNVMEFRSQLSQMPGDLDPEGDDPAMQDMVVIGHSMGGILTKTLVSRSGDDLWDAVSHRPFDQLVGSDQDLGLLREAAFFEPMPFVNRAVFIATPHRGAPMADNVVGALGDWMITLPDEVTEREGRILKDNPGAFRDAVSEGNTSIDTLSKSSLVLRTLTELPVRAGLPYHSIIGDITGEGPPEAYDGVVEYRSAHLDGARSELIVSHDHSAHRDPAAQLEIRRILREHLREQR